MNYFIYRRKNFEKNNFGNIDLGAYRNWNMGAEC